MKKSKELESAKKRFVDVEEYIDLELKIQKDKVRQRMIYALLMLVLVYILSIAVFGALEGWGWEDSLYFTTSTITTVGYGDFVPKSYFGRLFTIPLMLIGIAIGFYVIYALQDYGKIKIMDFSKGVEKIHKKINKKDAD